MYRPGTALLLLIAGSSWPLAAEAQPTLRLGAELGLGAWDRSVPVDHSAATVALPVDLSLTEWLWLGVNARYLVGGDANADADGDGLDDDDGANPKALLFTGGPRLVLHTEPARREAWRFGVSAGWLGTVKSGGDGAVLEALIERQAGTLLVDSPHADAGRGHDVALGLRLQQGLGAASEYRALFVTATYATELLVPLPGGQAPPRRRPDVEYTFGGDAAVGTAFGNGGFAYGIGLQVGLPLGRLLELRARGDAMRLSGVEQHEGSTIYSGLGGVRLSRWYLPWVEVLFGWSETFGAEPGAPTLQAVLDVAAGLQLPNTFGCGIGLRAGQRVRFGFGDDDQRLAALLFEVGLSYDNLIRASECSP